MLFLFQHGYTPLYLAVMENHPDICKTLLRNGADKVLAPPVSILIEIHKLQSYDMKTLQSSNILQRKYIVSLLEKISKQC